MTAVFIKVLVFGSIGLLIWPWVTMSKHQHRTRRRR